MVDEQSNGRDARAPRASQADAVRAHEAAGIAPMSAEAVGADFDHHSAVYRDRSHELLAAKRSGCPVARSENYGGFWVVATYEDAASVARDHTTFASYNDPEDRRVGGILIPSGPPLAGGIVETDNPRLGPIRRATNPFFSPAAVERMKPEIHKYTTWCIDQFIERGSADLVTELAAAVPALLTLRLLGLPQEEWTIYAEAMHIAGHVPPGDPREAERDRLHAWVYEKMLAIATERRAEPGDDLMSFFAHLKVDGELMPIAEVAGNGFLVLAGGLDTTTSLVGHSLIHLHDHPDDRAWLAADPSRLPRACEEFLRYFSPVQGLARTALCETKLHDQDVDAFDRVLVMWQGANLDPAEFDEPETIKLDRWPNRHLAFGAGIHRCLGSNMARAMWVEIVGQILDRLPDYQIDPGGVVRYLNIVPNNGLVHVPVTFSTGAVSGESAPDLDRLASASGAGRS